MSQPSYIRREIQDSIVCTILDAYRRAVEIAAEFAPGPNDWRWVERKPCPLPGEPEIVITPQEAAAEDDAAHSPYRINQVRVVLCGHSHVRASVSILLEGVSWVGRIKVVRQNNGEFIVVLPPRAPSYGSYTDLVFRPGIRVHEMASASRLRQGAPTTRCRGASGRRRNAARGANRRQIVIRNSGTEH